jgi:hypothetical protein
MSGSVWFPELAEDVSRAGCQLFSGAKKMVRGAVIGERVSAPDFPDAGNYQGKPRFLSPNGRSGGSLTRANPPLARQIPWDSEQGIISAIQGAMVSAGGARMSDEPPDDVDVRPAVAAALALLEGVSEAERAALAKPLARIAEDYVNSKLVAPFYRPAKEQMPLIGALAEPLGQAQMLLQAMSVQCDADRRAGAA